jgi:hypothetical protein
MTVYQLLQIKIFEQTDWQKLTNRITAQKSRFSRLVLYFHLGIYHEHRRGRGNESEI